MTGFTPISSISDCHKKTQSKGHVATGNLSWYNNIMELNVIIDSICKNRIRITDHADEEAQADGLLYEEIFFSVFQGAIIEDYPGDKPYPSCLIYGKTFSGDPVHSVWAYNEENQWTVLITVYKPDNNKWIDFRERRK